MDIFGRLRSLSLNLGPSSKPVVNPVFLSSFKKYAFYIWFAMWGGGIRVSKDLACHRLGGGSRSRKLGQLIQVWKCENVEGKVSRLVNIKCVGGITPPPCFIKGESNRSEKTCYAGYFTIIKHGLNRNN